MIPSGFILVSPGAVDGYPPVQYQARLLADAGHEVELVTTNLTPDRKGTSFHHPGVKIRCVSGHGRKEARMARFVRAVFAARRALSRKAVEIAYDPIGMLYSDMAPYRPHRRVAHFHELLQYADEFLERRLKKAVHRYDAVVVPDKERAAHIMEVLALAEQPIVIENYPLRASAPLCRPARAGSNTVELVYCGSLGQHQKLDAVIRSIAHWPMSVDFVLIGNEKTPTARDLSSLAASLGVADRVHFLGWMDTADAEGRMAQSSLGIALLDPAYEQWRTALGASNKRYQIMKAGLPQIGDQNPGVSDLLDGIGSCVTSHDPAEIGAVVAAYATDPGRCAEEGERAFARHQDLYNYERVFPRLHERIATW